MTAFILSTSSDRWKPHSTLHRADCLRVNRHSAAPVTVDDALRHAEKLENALRGAARGVTSYWKVCSCARKALAESLRERQGD